MAQGVLVEMGRGSRVKTQRPVRHVRRTPTDAERLSAVAREIEQHDLARAELLHRRDELVASLMAEGASRSEVARLAGVSRQSLLKRPSGAA